MSIRGNEALHDDWGYQGHIASAMKSPTISTPSTIPHVA